MVPTKPPHCCCASTSPNSHPRNNPANLRHCEPQEIILVPTNMGAHYPHHGILSPKQHFPTTTWWVNLSLAPL